MRGRISLHKQRVVVINATALREMLHTSAVKRANNVACFVLYHSKLLTSVSQQCQMTRVRQAGYGGSVYIGVVNVNRLHLQFRFALSRIDHSIGSVERRHNFNVAEALPVEARTTSDAS